MKGLNLCIHFENQLNVRKQFKNLWFDPFFYLVCNFNPKGFYLHWVISHDEAKMRTSADISPSGFLSGSKWQCSEKRSPTFRVFTVDVFHSANELRRLHCINNASQALPPFCFANNPLGAFSHWDLHRESLRARKGWQPDLMSKLCSNIT